MTVNRTTLSAAWAEFERDILDPIEASQVQRTEMRRAWYAGASRILDMLVLGIDPNAEPTAEDLAYVQSLARELEAFGNRLQSGRA